MSLFRCVFKRCIFCPNVEGKFNKNPGVGDILVEIQLIARADNINTVKSRAVDRSTIQFWNFLAKGHST